MYKISSIKHSTAVRKEKKSLEDIEKQLFFTISIPFVKHLQSFTSNKYPINLCSTMMSIEVPLYRCTNKNRLYSSQNLDTLDSVEDELLSGYMHTVIHVFTNQPRVL